MNLRPMKRLLRPLLLLVAQATEKELVLYIEYLKTENRILGDKLPKRITVTPAEKARLVKLGVRLGSAIKEVTTIVHWRTDRPDGQGYWLGSPTDLGRATEALHAEHLPLYHCPHQGLGNVPITASLPPPEPLENFRLEDVECQTRLGGLLKHYERKAA